MAADLSTWPMVPSVLVDRALVLIFTTRDLLSEKNDFVASEV